MEETGNVFGNLCLAALEYCLYHLSERLSLDSYLTDIAIAIHLNVVFDLL